MSGFFKKLFIYKIIHFMYNIIIMKKIKIITSLSAVTALGGGVALTATSCSKNNDGGKISGDKDNGNVTINSQEDVKNFINKTDFVNNDATGTLNSVNNDANIKTIGSFLEKNVSAVMLAQGLAAGIVNSNIEENVTVESVYWKTENNSGPSAVITFAAKVKATIEGQTKEFDYGFKLSKTTNSCFDRIELLTSEESKDIHSLTGIIVLDEETSNRIGKNLFLIKYFDYNDYYIKETFNVPILANLLPNVKINCIDSYDKENNEINLDTIDVAERGYDKMEEKQFLYNFNYFANGQKQDLKKTDFVIDKVKYAQPDNMKDQNWVIDKNNFEIDVDAKGNIGLYALRENWPDDADVVGWVYINVIKDNNIVQTMIQFSCIPTEKVKIKSVQAGVTGFGGIEAGQPVTKVTGRILPDEELELILSDKNARLENIEISDDYATTKFTRDVDFSDIFGENSLIISFKEAGVAKLNASEKYVIKLTFEQNIATATFSTADIKVFGIIPEGKSFGGLEAGTIENGAKLTSFPKSGDELEISIENSYIALPETQSISTIKFDDNSGSALIFSSDDDGTDTFYATTDANKVIVQMNAETYSVFSIKQTWEIRLLSENGQKGIAKFHFLTPDVIK